MSKFVAIEPLMIEIHRWCFKGAFISRVTHHIGLAIGKLMLGLYKRHVEYLDNSVLNNESKFCGVLTFEKEMSRLKNNKCHQGKIILPPTDEYPTEMKDLLLGTTKMIKPFWGEILEFIIMY
ncbi:hypothetical protein TNIN_51031 [Trichonephila inaurata madagascariensis]|uniref:Uncharacterized protein n=1 Tax=Trichonephila inaurata madagascariensis TaxID=2747483 RepID=A0A8X6XG93_9ARAC|nr:hypothetical protein TNIN_51031 [Trichonephila inaurata madagascariensis]